MELISVINCDDRPAGLIVWKHPGENFNFGSQLVVPENEEALFMRNGVIEALFQGGKFELKTENYAFIKTLRATISAGVNAFPSKVYYVNKTHALELAWCMEDGIQVNDPKFEIFTKVYARGSYSVQVEDSKKFFVKFVDSTTEKLTPQTITVKFDSVFMQHIKTLIARNIRELGETIVGITSRLDEFAEMARKRLADVFNEYGLRLVNFYVSAVELDESHPGYAKLVELQTHAATKKLEAEGDAAYMERLGANYKIKRGLDIAAMIAEKPPASGGTAAVSGLATELPQALLAVNLLRETMRDALGIGAAATPTLGASCAACGKPVSPTARFCGHCRAPVASHKTCHKCNAILPASAGFCEQCGESLS